MPKKKMKRAFRDGQVLGIVSGIVSGIMMALEEIECTDAQIEGLFGRWQHLATEAGAGLDLLSEIVASKIVCMESDGTPSMQALATRLKAVLEIEV